MLPFSQAQRGAVRRPVRINRSGGFGPIRSPTVHRGVWTPSQRGSPAPGVFRPTSPGLSLFSVDPPLQKKNTHGPSLPNPFTNFTTPHTLKKNTHTLKSPHNNNNAHTKKTPTKTRASSGGAAAVPESERTILGIKTMTWKKILPLGFMMFCILFNYTILRDTKDVLVVTAPGSGAEIIPFLKTWVNLPLAIGFTILYAKLANILSNEQLFYTCIFPFIAFFGAFAFFMYPLREVLHPTAFAEKLLEVAGPRFAGPIAILRNWTFCLFYVMAELWGSVVVSVLFWGFANQITTVDEATQFYPLFGLGANVALIFSGRAVKYFSQVRANLPPEVDGWGLSLKGLMAMVVIGGLVISATYWWMNRAVVPYVEKRAAKKKKKAKMSVGESFKFLLKSRYIRDLATLVIAYGISINLVEVTWKSKLKAQFPNPNDYSAFMGDFSSATGTVTLIMMLASRYIFQKFGWGVAALITPTVLLITGVMFFGLILFGGPIEPLLQNVGMTPLYLAVLVGAAQNIFSKSAKYSLFDPCKETAYIPLDDEVRTKGKAAIDVICNPLGKSGGALIQQVLIISLGSLAVCVPYLGVILLGIVGAWIVAAKSLDTQFTELQKEEMRAKLHEAKKALLQQRKAVKRYRYKSKATQEGFAEGVWVPIEDKNKSKEMSATGASDSGNGSVHEDVPSTLADTSTTNGVKDSESDPDTTPATTA